MTKLKQFVTDNRTWIIWTLVAITVLVLLALFAFSVWRYGWEWTGLVSYTTPKSATQEFHPGKTLWDVLALIFIPAVLAFLGAMFRRIESGRAAKREELEQQLELDRQREAALRSYLGAMTELLLDKELRTSEEAQSIARSRTLTVLRGLDGERKGSVLRFLYEAKLIGFRERVIGPKKEADLKEAKIVPKLFSLLWPKSKPDNGADSEETRSVVSLERADLSGAYLEGADLSDAFLGSANLWGPTCPAPTCAGLTCTRSVCSRPT